MADSCVVSAPQIIPRPPHVEVVTASLALPGSVELSEAHIRSTLQGRVGQAVHFEDTAEPHESAVAIVMSPDPHDDIEVVLTRRSWAMRRHAGEVSFPGGLREPGDETLLDTALREAFEEVGLDRAIVEPIGEIDHARTNTTDRIIVPHVVWSAARPQLCANTDEVDRILHIRLSQLLLPGVFHEERWNFGGSWHSLYFFDVGHDLIWGATAAMLVNLFNILAHRTFDLFARRVPD